MTMNNTLHAFRIDDAQLRRFGALYRRYQQLFLDPEHCSPMFIISVPPVDPIPWEERLADPMVMLRACLAELEPHLAIEDDHVPTVRVEFGTGQVAAAFGCELVVPPNSLPASKGPIMHTAQDVYRMRKPALTAGWYGKLAEWTALWQRVLPPGIQIQHPDIQSAFNTAHLVRGNDILTDFYDDPVALDALLDLVTDTMIDLTRHLKAMISNDADWFFDWGGLWKGYARISNCSMHMISPRFYREHVAARDARFFNAVGGGRMHYCGTYGEVIREFFKTPSITGLDFDAKYHDLFALSEIAPKNVTLLTDVAENSDLGRRLLSGDWPAKRNLIITSSAPTLSAARDLLARFRCSVERGD
jgi:hypothetical protein